MTFTEAELCQHLNCQVHPCRGVDHAGVEGNSTETGTPLSDPHNVAVCDTTALAFPQPSTRQRKTLAAAKSFSGCTEGERSAADPQLSQAEQLSKAQQMAPAHTSAAYA